MAKFVFGDSESQERFRECASLPVDRDKMTLSKWLMWKVSSYKWDDTVTLWYNPYEKNYFDFSINTANGDRIIVGGLLYRNGGWESHT